jgi:hypothetical protein
MRFSGSPMGDAWRAWLVYADLSKETPLAFCLSGIWWVSTHELHKLPYEHMITYDVSTYRSRRLRGLWSSKWKKFENGKVFHLYVFWSDHESTRVQHTQGIHGPHCVPEHGQRVGSVHIRVYWKFQKEEELATTNLQSHVLLVNPSVGPWLG